MTTEHGRIVSVTSSALGSSLAVDALTGDVSVSVSDAGDFDELEGGTLSIGGSQYDYSAVDNDADLITLSSALLADASAGDRVDVWDTALGEAGREYRAQVELPGYADNDDALDCSVAQSLVPLLAEGIRAPGQGESVTITLDDTEWTVTDVRGKKPSIEPGNVTGAGYVIAGEAQSAIAAAVNSVKGGGATFREAQYGSGDDVVFGYGRASDAYPQVVFFAGMGNGIYFGDGTVDPASGPPDTANIFAQGHGLVVAASDCDLTMTEHSARLFLDANGETGKAVLRGDSTASLTITPASGQTAPTVVLTVAGGATQVLTVAPDGTVEIHGAGVGIIMASPDGTRYAAAIANGGTWSIAPA